MARLLGTICPIDDISDSQEPGTRLQTSDGLTLACRWWEPVVDGSATVVLVHGFTGSKDDPQVVALAQHLVAEGHRVLAYDARGHGASKGRCTLGDDERFDVTAAVDAAQETGLPVVAVGASMGAIALLRAAADQPGLAGVVTVSSPAQWRLPRNLRGVAAALSTRTGAGRWAVGRLTGVRIEPRWAQPEPPTALVGRSAAPLAILHGEDDRFIPASESAVLHEQVRGPGRRVLVPGMGHAFEAAGHRPISDAIAWTLRLARTPAVG